MPTAERWEISGLPAALTNNRLTAIRHGLVKNVDILDAKRADTDVQRDWPATRKKR